VKFKQPGVMPGCCYVGGLRGLAAGQQAGRGFQPGDGPRTRAAGELERAPYPASGVREDAAYLNK